MQAADTRHAPHQARPPEPLATFAERINAALSVARGLLLAGRAVDLDGIQDGIGLLCAKTLDLPRAEGRQMLPLLHETLAQIDSLSSALRHRGEA